MVVEDVLLVGLVSATSQTSTPQIVVARVESGKERGEYRAIDVIVATHDGKDGKKFFAQAEYRPVVVCVQIILVGTEF